MKVSELIEILQRCDMNAEVKAYTVGMISKVVERNETTRLPDTFFIENTIHLM